MASHPLKKSRGVDSLCSMEAHHVPLLQSVMRTQQVCAINAHKALEMFGGIGSFWGGSGLIHGFNDCTVRMEGSDVGLGLTVPNEPLSHERDSAHVNGHSRICIPGALCGNQCAALFDAMPTCNKFLCGGWTDTTFIFAGI